MSDLSIKENVPTSGTPSSLDHMPAGAWEFDHAVTAVFDDMLARSIPQLDTMRTLIFEVARRHVQPGTHIVDLGCSVGGAMRPLIEEFASQNRFVGMEASAPMVEACRHRLQSWIDRDIVDIRCGDVRTSYPAVSASVTLCVLTLMFTPIEHRSRILATAHKHTVPGGAFLLVEKILGTSASAQALMNDLYEQHKADMGYTRESIDRKRLALEGVLVPVTAHWNEQMLYEAGFARVECLWRWVNFAGWLAVKA